MSIEKDRREIAEIARKYNFDFDGLTSKGHFRWRRFDGLTVFTVSKLGGTVKRRELGNAERMFTRALRGRPAT